MIGDFAQDCRFITIADNPRVYISIETFFIFLFTFMFKLLQSGASF